jgi:hypothetical protein
MTIAAWAQVVPLHRVVSERFIGQFHSLGMPASLRISPDSKRVAEATYDDIAATMLTFFSPDSARVAYAAQVGKKWFTVVDGKEEQQYDGVGQGSLTFSPDGKRLAYGAKGGNKSWFVVIEGSEGKRYASLLRGGNRVVFDSPDTFHYLAETGERIHLVEEAIR